MKLFLPRPQTPASDKVGTVSSELWRFFRGLMASLGWVPDAPVYRCEYLPGASLRFNSVLGGLYVVTAGNTEVPAFNVGVDMSLQFGFVFPPDVIDGTEAELFIDWAPTTALGGDLILRCEHEETYSGHVYAPGTAVTIYPAAPTVTHQTTRTVLATIAATDVKKKAVVCGCVSRLGSGPLDTYGAAVLVFGIGLTYRAEGIGHEHKEP